MDDVKLMKELDFASFEEEFKLNPTPIGAAGKGGGKAGAGGKANAAGDATDAAKKVKMEKQKIFISDLIFTLLYLQVSAPQLDSLMEHTRLKNMAICRRKLPPLATPDLVRAINALDIQTLNQDTVELLQRMVPQEAEIKAYR